VTNKKIRIELKGAKIDNEFLRLPELVEALQGINEVLSHIDHILSQPESHSLYFRVTGLSCGSPAIVETEAVPIERSVDHSAEVIRRFFTGLNDIKRGKAPKEFGVDVLESYKNVSKVLKKNVTDIVLTSEGVHVELKEDLEPKITEIIGEDEIMQGSVSGILERINIHAGVNKFRIYPVAGAKKVDCHFPDSLLKKATGAVDRYINVEGKIKYKGKANFPYAVEIEDIEIYPEESELPTFSELRGIAPNATGSLSSEEFVKRIRSGH